MKRDLSVLLIELFWTCPSPGAVLFDTGGVVDTPLAFESCVTELVDVSLDYPGGAPRHKVSVGELVLQQGKFPALENFYCGG